MNTRLLMMGSLSALVLGGATVGCTAHGGTNRLASAGDRNDAASGKAAADKSTKALKALARHDAPAAVDLAEAAVALAPRDVGYRLVLGQSYLQAGRFAAARTAFGDVLALQPEHGRAALNLALAQIATGDWAAARTTLDTHAATIPAGDRGLAVALAGDPTAGVEILKQVVRSPESTPKARQNLALALALAGQWQSARVVAAADMAPAEVDARMEQWAAFAQPHGASDQVATLLGVKAAEDRGQPVALALNAPVQMADATPALAAPVQVAAVTPVSVPVPVSVQAPAPAPAPVTVPVPAPVVASATPRPVASQVVPPAQPARVRLIRAPDGAIKVALARTVAPAPASARPVSRGNWFVQIGAFGSAGVAKDAWGRATRRLPALARHGASGTTFRANKGQFYRLSVGGFARGDADALCRRYRSTGGACFVRSVAGDRIAGWWSRRGGVQLASR
jgi:Flp pilus assembly protein TadD